jgi:hypothetical protein
MDLLGERMTKARPSLGLISTGFIVSLLELFPGEGYIAGASNAARFVDGPISSSEKIRPEIAPATLEMPIY